MNIIEIESKDNQKIKELKKLKLKKYRDKSGFFCVENWKIIQDGLVSGFVFEELFVTDVFFKKNEAMLAEIFLQNKLTNLIVIPEKLNSVFSALDTPPGVVAVYKKIAQDFTWDKPFVYLNKIADPGNLGTILRSGVAFGLENIILDSSCVDLYNAKTIQAAKDAIFKLNIQEDNGGEIIGEIKKRGIKIYATNVEKGRDLREALVEKKENYCLILGNESSGVSPELLTLADELINIKTSDKIESLNVAVSAGIIFYELFNLPTSKLR